MECGLVSIDCYVWHFVRHGCRICSSAKKFVVLLFGFPPVAFLIFNRFQCVISQMKENTYLIKFITYYFWVEVMPFQLWSNEFTVKLLFVHCRSYTRVLTHYKVLLRKCIKCDCVIAGTPKWSRNRWPASDTRWLGLADHGAAVREVRGSKPGVATTLLLTLFRVR